MPVPRASDIVLFGPFKLDLKAGELHKHGRKIRLQEQPFQLLKILLEHPGQVVAREELRERLWPDDTNVEFRHSINSAINRLRGVLGDTPDKPKYVETVARRGYRLLLSVNRELSDSASPTVPVAEAHMESAVSGTRSRSTRRFHRQSRGKLRRIKRQEKWPVCSRYAHWRQD
jgi:DNA-binding winged helix-turn-helix (wHTH) protein